MIVTPNDDAFNDLQYELTQAQQLLDALDRLIDGLRTGETCEDTTPLMRVAYVVSDKITAANEMLDRAWGASDAQTATPAVQTAKRPSVSKAVKPRRRIAA